jgi:hypothetical protein
MLILVSIDYAEAKLTLNGMEIRAAIVSRCDVQFSVGRMVDIKSSYEVRWLLLVVVFSYLLINYFLFLFRLMYWKEARRYQTRLLEQQSRFY